MHLLLGDVYSPVVNILQVTNLVYNQVIKNIIQNFLY